MKGVATAIALYSALFLSLLLWSVPHLPPLGMALAALAAAGCVAAGFVALTDDRRAAPVLAVFLAATLSLGALFFAGRVIFIAKNGGLESADGIGSPLAFMIGWAWEQMSLTVPSLGLALVALAFVAPPTSRSISE